MKQEKRLRRRRTTWSTRMITALLVLIIAPMFVLVSILIDMSTRRLESQAYELVDYRTKQSVRFLEADLERTFDLLYQIINDSAVMDAMSDMRAHRAPVESKMSLRAKFLSYGQIIPEIQSIAFLADDTDVYYAYEKFNSSQSNRFWADKRMRETLYLLASTAEHAVFIPTEAQELVGGHKMDLFFICIPLRDYVTKKYQGALTIGVSMDFFRNLYEGDREDTRWGAQIEVVDDNGWVIYSQDQRRIGQQATQRAQPARQKTIVRSASVAGANWTLHAYISQNELLAELQGFRIMTVIVAVVFAIPFAIVVFMFSRYFTRNLSQLSASLKSFGEGSLGMQLDTAIEDEFYPVIMQFNRMSRKVRALVERLGEEKKNTSAAVQRQHRAELRALEAQINPHFLYNTLDTINWIAIDNEQYEISEMLANLANLMRYSVCNIDMLTTVREEKAWLEQYLFLQRKRFVGSFAYCIDIPEAAMQLQIHKMLLQPIIENSIMHGFSGIKSGGKIEVLATIKEGRTLRFEVRDNGCGMSEEVRRALNGGDTEAGSHLHIGARNVKARLQSYYGEAARLVYEKGEPAGIRVVLEVPYQKEEERAKNIDC